SVQLQSGAQLSGRPVHAGLGAGCTQAEHGPDLIEGKVEVEVQEQRQSLLRRQSPESTLEVGAICAGCLELGACAVEIGKADHRPPSSSADAAALVGDDGQEPGPRRAAILELAEAPPGLERRVLKRVSALVAIAQGRQGPSAP